MWDDADRELEYDRDRQALSQLLSARGEQHAAALVAVSAYRDEYVDGLNGGQYDAILAVPPELYDQARGEFREVIESACADIIICRFPNSLSSADPLNCGDASCLTRCHRAFVSNSCHLFQNPSETTPKVRPKFRDSRN